MRTLILAALFATAAASPALAQPAGNAPFTGLRIEGLVGYDHVKNHGYGDNAVAYGLGAGYDMQMGRAVVGGEVEYMDSNAKGCDTDFAAIGDKICGSARRDLYAGARVGAEVSPGMLLYAKAGYTNARIATRYDGVTGGPASFSDKTNLDGVRVGAGAEYAFSPNSFIKAEYRYSNYEKGVSRQQVLGGFGFRF
ncbi:outer membrane protein [Sphingomonas flavalba]|uniref:outer membrane protein n=1 Tax=Sphingomonas flavalba TaxID=2559804 RepID=UPI0039E197B2